jgi:sugar lactone lactonase YvrE
MSSLAPFQPGDVFVSATRQIPDSRYPTGHGRVWQLDSALNLKAEAETGRVGLVSGMGLSPDRVLFVTDAQARGLDLFGADGLHRANFADYTPLAFGSVVFTKDGGWLLAEHLCGKEGPFQGDGKVHRFDREGKKVAVYDTVFNGGVGGFLGVTHMALSTDERTLYHVSETGAHVYAHDLAANKPLGAFYTRDDQPPMVFGICPAPDGGLVLACGSEIRRLGADGKVAHRYDMGGGRGWAVVVARPDGKRVWAADFYGGTLVSMDIMSGTKDLVKDLGLAKSLAGIAEVPI